MELSKRLQAIAEYVNQDAIVADIGTDHAYLPIYLRRHQIARTVIAMDINKGPLEIAKHNIRAGLLEGTIQTRLSNGLNKLKIEDQVNTIIIAGMGGHLIKSILDEGKDKLLHIGQLILQPQSDMDVVRRTVHNLGFMIVDEKIVEDASKIYFILLCQKGNEAFSQDIYYKYGKILIQKKDSLFLTYLNNLINQKQKVIKHLKEQCSQESQKRLEELLFEVKELEVAIDECNSR